MDSNKDNPASMSSDSSSEDDNNSEYEVDSSLNRTAPRRGTVADLRTPSKDDPCLRHRRTSVPPSMRYDRKKEDNLFPPTKKYRYYPVTCEYCLKRLQPNKLKSHQQKHHFGISEEGRKVRMTQSAGTSKVATQESPRQQAGSSQSVGGMPRRLKICYICGRMFGSKSLPIHEPKCLEKWRIQNDQLPPEFRAQEPVKPEPIVSKVAEADKDGLYSLPPFDPAAEAAFQSHLATLIPCPHCSRTFSPDRIQKHSSCCIDRPRTRECVTPEGGEIKR